ncbi:MAG: S8 family peptidase [Polyangiaceae bacterium]|nr:S8 family peptidase [Polyangiaceae bacterium]
MHARLFVSIVSIAAFAWAAAAPRLARADAQAQASFGLDRAADTVPGEIAIDVRDDASVDDLAAIAADYGLSMRPNSAFSRTHDKLEVADVDPAREASFLDALARDPRVEHAEPMALYGAAFVPDDPLYSSKQWHLQRVGAERAWSYTCGRGVTVAVVDTGVACFDRGPFSRGTDLAGTRCEGGWNFVDDSAHAYDDQGHGTHVAGTIAQTTNNGVGTAGLAYCATLMPVKVLNRQGFGTVANVAEGIRYAADEGAQVINLSLGGPIKSKILEDAIRHALDKGVVVVAAAGNSGRRVGWPAAYPGVIAVSATDANDTIASFSSRGPEVWVAAPGVGVTQQTICNGGRDKCEIFGTFNGTSMASPHVAGVAAMVEAMGVTRGPAVAEVIASSAREKSEDTRNLYGAGILDGGAAVARVFWGHFIERVFALVAFGWAVRRQIRKRGGSMSVTLGVALGAMLGGVGLFAVAPLFGLASSPGWMGAAAQLAMRPLGEWDLVVGGVGLHQAWLLASALPVVGLSAVGFASRRARPFIGGIALGTAALLAQMTWSGDVAFAAGPALGKLWALVNIGLCLWIARVGLERSGAARESS